MDNPIFLPLVTPPPPIFLFFKHQILKAGVTVRGISDYGLDVKLKLKMQNMMKLSYMSN